MLAVRSRIAILLAMMTPGVAAACPISWRDAELQVVPANGGVFVDVEHAPPGCELSLRRFGMIREPLVRLEQRVDDPGLYWPTRALTPSASYALVIEGEACPLHDLWVLAVPWRDDEAPRWLGPPSVESARYRASCMQDDVLIDLDVPVIDQSPVRMQVEARPLFDIGRTIPAVAVLRDPCVTIDWRIWPEPNLEPGMPYVARVCAEDAAGNRSCAPLPILFLTPRAGVEPPESLDSIVLRRVPPLDVVGPAPAEPMQPTALLHDRVDWPRVWRNGRWIGLALLCVVVVALGRARVRRAIRAA